MTRRAADRAAARPRRVATAVVGILAGLLSSLTTGAVTASAAADEADPGLRVSIDTLAPATVPDHGRVRVSGVVTNRSDHVWHDVKAYLVVSAAPLRTRAELADAAASDPTTDIGGRITQAGLFQVLGDLQPGAATPYELSVPRRDLPIEGTPGVYWLGVHVLGADDAGRDTVADGRARTFLPLLDRTARRQGARTRMALLVPVEDRVRRGAGGRLLGEGRWQRSVSPDGRLDRLLRLSAGTTTPFTWVLDPAVLDAVDSVAHGNPPLDTGPSAGATGAGGEPSAGPSADGSPSPSASSPSPGASASPDESGQSGDATAATPEQRAAAAWLAALQDQASGRTVTSVPYGGLDAAAVLSGARRNVYAEAARLSADTLTSFGLTAADPVLDPVAGTLPDAALRRVPADTPVVLHGTAYPDDARAVLRQTGRPPVVLVADAGGGSVAGAAPGPRRSALAVRQRLLSEAALHALSPERGTALVLSTPAYWNPGSASEESGFFDALQQPWLRLVDLPTLLAGNQRSTDPRPPVYPRTERAAQLPAANLAATRRLTGAGRAFAELLTDNDTIDDTLARVAVLASSEAARDAPRRAAARADASTALVRAQMDRVHVEGPPFVMMSSQQGAISVRLVNDLDQPVTVGVRAQARGGRLQVSAGEPVRLGPGERTAVRLEAHSTDIGVHSVTVYATTADGTPVGGGAQFDVRTSHVSTVIWVIIGVGAVVLFLAIVVRLVRRLRRRRRTHGPLLPRPAAPDPADPSGPHDRIGA